MNLSVLAAFRHQARICRALGSPLTSAVCEAIAFLLESRSPVVESLQTWKGDPKDDALALRICGGLHALVIIEADRGLAAAYRDAEISFNHLQTAIGQAFICHERMLLNWIESPPQTNEIARSACIFPGLLTLAQHFKKPIALFEIGASAGFNLLVDRLRYIYGHASCGSSSARICLAPQMRGQPLPLDGSLTILRRAGCDRMPIDASSFDGQLRLQAYIWADQWKRLERCRAAIALAQTSEIRVEQCEAADFIERIAGQLSSEVVTIVIQSVVWPYLSEDSRRRITAALQQGGQGKAPLAWLRFEGDDQGQACVTVRLWPGGQDFELARAGIHGDWLEWHGVPRLLH